MCLVIVLLHSAQVQLLAKAHKQGQLDQLYAALTDLGEVPW
jgi:putative lipoic acid-binding regulatory protein